MGLRVAPFDQPPHPTKHPPPLSTASVGPGQAAAPLSGFYEGTDKISARSISVFCLVLPGNQTERGEIMGQTRCLPRDESGETCSPRAHANDAALIAVVS